MGAIHFSIDIRLARMLAENIGIKIFVETGTFEGNTLSSAAEFFSTLHSIELSPELHSAAVSRFANDPSIVCHLGDSPGALSGILKGVGDQPILAWLDAHWCSGDNTAGIDSQCPLLNEIKALTPLNPNSVIWIDDARYFMAPPPTPLVMRGWPTFQEVLDHLNQASGWGHEVIIANDTILFVPKTVAEKVREYLYHNGADWLKIACMAREFPNAIAGREGLAAVVHNLEKELYFERTRRLMDRIKDDIRRRLHFN